MYDPTGLPRPWTANRIVLASLCALLLVIGAALFSVRAAAVLSDVPETGTPGHLSMRADPNPGQFLGIAPGTPAYWQIAVDLQDAASASLAIEMRKDGALAEHPDGLSVTVERCDTAWTGFPSSPRCASTSTIVTTATPLNDYSASSPVLDLAGITPEESAFLLVTLAVDDSAAAATDESLMNLSADIAFGLTAASRAVPEPAPSAGPSLSPEPSPGTDPASHGATRPGRAPLGATGADVTALLLVGIGAVGLGVVVSSTRATRRTAHATLTEQETS